MKWQEGGSFLANVLFMSPSLLMVFVSDAPRFCNTIPAGPLSFLLYFTAAEFGSTRSQSGLRRLTYGG